ncbi:uncharacterized protein LOC127074374 isoform X2 [Lathyrus oleraceus]|uniref:uncharacterized protein LOC127074374 isoform X2 n=1 Tax=Pisum sativum TaxID=3888 RepID=UPI0021D0C7C3|nr:uncharacterized protein LOC127074374 isoform X2 [Pisum sativum]
MPAARYIPPINTLDQKLQIQRRLGGLKSCKYFNLLTMYLNMKVTKPDFDKLCIAIIGNENVPLHNHFLKSILKKACLSKAAPPRQSVAEGSLKVKMPNGCNGLPPLGKNSRKCRTPNLRDRRFKHHPSPLGPHGKNSSIGFENSTPVIQEHQIDIDIHPVGNGLHVSVEHREEVNPDSEKLSINRRSPVRAPLGPHGKNNVIGFENSTPKSQQHQMDTDLHPVGNGFDVSVEHREEVNRDSERLAINRRSPIRAPLGPHGKNNVVGFENSTPKSDLHPVGNGFHVSVEHREEVNLDSERLAINRRSPRRAPLGPHGKNNVVGFENSTPKSDLHPVGNGFHVPVEHREVANRDSEGLAINRRTPMRAPLGPHLKNNNIGFENSTPKFQEHRVDTDLHPVRKTPHLSVEHREEVNRDSKGLPINRRTPMQLPLGPHVKNKIIGFKSSISKLQKQLVDTDLHPVRKRPHLSVEHREEVNRDSKGLAINRRTAMRARVGPLVKNNSIGFENSTPKFPEHQIDTDLHPVRNGFHVSVEHREEVNRDSERLAINRTLIRAPLGLPTYDNRAQIFTHQGLQSGIVTDTCQSTGYLPDTYSLMKRMEHNMETKGCNLTADAAYVLNTALDIYLKKLIKPCFDIADSISVNKFSSQTQPGMNELPRNRHVQKPIGSASASASEFRTSMELNPTILGEDWPLHIERTSILAFEERDKQAQPFIYPSYKYKIFSK